MNASGQTTTEELIPQELKGMFRELRMRHWTLILWGGKAAPELYASMFRYPAHADVLLLRNRDDATAYRVPVVGETSVFNPRMVVYQFHSSALWTLRAIMRLPAPGEPYSPMIMEEPRAKCLIPDDLPQPVIVRPLSSQ